MRLVRAAKGAGRVPAIEVLVSTAFIRDHIINEEKTYLIREAIAAGTSQYGMQTFDQSLFHLLQSRLISQEEALHNATNPDEFKMRVSGIYSKTTRCNDITTPATATDDATCSQQRAGQHLCKAFSLAANLLCAAHDADAGAPVFVDVEAIDLDVGRDEAREFLEGRMDAQSWSDEIDQRWLITDRSRPNSFAFAMCPRRR
jgi:hypothetical protein